MFGDVAWPSLHTLPEGELKVLQMNDNPFLLNQTPYNDATELFKKLGFFNFTY